MVFPSCLTDSNVRLVIDSSAAINITATGCAVQLVKALPNEIVVVDTVIAELEQGRRKGRPHPELFGQLVAAGHVTVVGLNEAASGDFEDLVIGPAVSTLDDGEAATLAFAVNDGAMPIIDERKAARICQKRFPRILMGCTADLLAHRDVEVALGKRALSNAVFSALQGARMRIPPQYTGWVVDLIGADRAATCNSLPLRARKRTG